MVVACTPAFPVVPSPTDYYSVHPDESLSSREHTLRSRRRPSMSGPSAMSWQKITPISTLEGVKLIL